MALRCLVLASIFASVQSTDTHAPLTSGLACESHLCLLQTEAKLVTTPYRAPPVQKMLKTEGSPVKDRELEGQPSAVAMVQSTSTIQSRMMEFLQTGRRKLIVGVSARGLGSWIGGIFVGTMAGLTMGTDDVVWFLPFAVGPKKWRNALAYFFCMEFVVLISYCIVGLGGELQEHFPDAPVQRGLEVASSVLLTAYTLFLLSEWYYDTESPDDSEDDVEQVSEVLPAAAVLQNAAHQDSYSKSTTDTDDISAPAGSPGDSISKEEKSVDDSVVEDQAGPADSAKKTSDRCTLTSLFIISMFGSLDNLAVYVALMLNSMIDVFQLALGVILSSALIVVICFGATSLQRVVDVVERIPLWIFISAITVWSYLEVVTVA